jgi:hypothetical protein
MGQPKVTQVVSIFITNVNHALHFFIRKNASAHGVFIPKPIAQKTISIIVKIISNLKKIISKII